MNSVTVYNADSMKARDILARVGTDDVLSEVMECTGKVYIEQCFFNTRRRFDGGLEDLELKMIGKVKELFIEDYEDRQFPCSTKVLNFMDAEPVMINMQLTAKEKGHLYECGVDHPGFEPPANMKFNTMEIPMLIEYKGIYESPVCFARIIRPNEIQTSTKKCGYYGLFDLVSKHPDVVREEENGGIDINLTKASPELRMAPPAKTVVPQQIHDKNKALSAAIKEQAPEHKSVAEVKEVIQERLNAKPVEKTPSRETVTVYHEAVAEYEEKTTAQTGSTNVADIDMDGNTQTEENIVPYTVRKMDSPLYDILSQKASEHADGSGDTEADLVEGESKDLREEKEKEQERSIGSEFGDEDKSLSKAEREARRQINLARKADIAADNKALNMDAGADISGQGASVRKTSAQELLGDIMGNDKGSSGQQFL